MALTTIPAAGAKLRGATLSSLITELRVVYGIKSSDQNVGPSNTTLQDVTDLGLSVVANATYEFAAYIQYSTNTTADLKVGFTFPTGLTMDYGLLAFNTTEVWVTSRGIQTTVLQVGGTGTMLYLNGSVVVGANAGTLQLQAAQATSTAITTNIEQGSTMLLKRLA